MSREVDLSAIKDAIDRAVQVIDAYLDEQPSRDAVASDVPYAENLKSVLETMGATIAAECGNPHFRPTLGDES